MQVRVTEDDIIHGLKALGITRGSSIEVHCSMSSFGYVEGGANAVINALKSAVGNEGCIVMPAFRLSPDYPLSEIDKALGLTLRIRLLANDDEKSAMGVVADTFRKMSDVKVGGGIIQEMAFEQKLIKTTRIGNSTCMAFPVHTVVSMYRDQLIKDALGLYGLG